MEGNTRFRTNEDSSRLDLQFTKEPEIIEDNYRTLIGKSDHTLFEFGLEKEMKERRKVDYRKCRQNYSKTNFTKLRKILQGD